MAPQVSVLLPVYDGEAMLPACLESILAQSFTDFEVVAVDDGSGDGSGALLEEFARGDGRIRPLRIAHGGIVAALNAGLAACRGAYIARMDVDDLMHPHRLERQLAWLQSHPECDLVGSLVRAYGIGREVSDGALRYHDWLNSLLDDDGIKGGLFVDSPIAHSTFFARRGLYERLQGYRDCTWAEDYDFLFRAYFSGAAFAKVPQVLLDRGDWDGRLTRVDPRCKRKAMFAAKAHYFAAGGWLAGKAGVVIAGSGPSGRVMAAHLRGLEVPLRAFVDNRAGPPGRTVMGIPACGDPAGPPAAFLAAHRDAFFALCIGEAASRAAMMDRLEDMGLRQGRDYLRFI
jgi:glycosyltransferase involved in cell wall biosynthesis